MRNTKVARKSKTSFFDGFFLNGDNKRYEYVMSIGVERFPIEDLGISPDENSRFIPYGYCCDYSVEQGELTVCNLEVTPLTKLPIIEGIEPIALCSNGDILSVYEVTEKTQIEGYYYDNLNIKHECTGRIIIGFGITSDGPSKYEDGEECYFIRYELQPFWFFKILKELYIENGMIVRIIDRSAETVKARKILKENQVAVMNVVKAYELILQHENEFEIKEYLHGDEMMDLYNAFK